MKAINFAVIIFVIALHTTSADDDSASDLDKLIEGIFAESDEKADVQTQKNNSNEPTKPHTTSADDDSASDLEKLIEEIFAVSDEKADLQDQKNNSNEPTKPTNAQVESQVTKHRRGTDPKDIPPPLLCTLLGSC